MFWWSVPVGLTGLLIAGIAIIIILPILLFSNGEWLDGGPVFIFIVIFLVIGTIGLAMALFGFFFWSLGEIWSPYI